MSKQTTKWGHREKQAWLKQQIIQRSYQDDVVFRVRQLQDRFETLEYGALSIDPKRYPLLMLKTPSWDKTKPSVLITGGVHGYETSGVLGTLRFAEKEALRYSAKFNIVLAPCVSPWSYETINRWNPLTIDPNRSFLTNSLCEESASLMNAIASIDRQDKHDPVFDLLAHFDLHETTDSDNTTFRPALAEKDGIEQSVWDIPDGFYLVSDKDNPSNTFQRAIIQSVKRITHIAPADKNNKIIGEPLVQEGVIHYEAKKLGLCIGFSNSRYSTTTEMYPDSTRVSPEDCVLAQVAAITGGLEYLSTLI